MKCGDFVVFKSDFEKISDIHDFIRAFEVYSVTTDDGVYLSSLTHVDSTELLVIPKQHIISFTDPDVWEYFYSTDYLQDVPSRFIPGQITIPRRIILSNIFPDGILKDIYDYQKLYHRDEHRLPNPDPSYEPVWKTVIELLQDEYGL